MSWVPINSVSTEPASSGASGTSDPVDMTGADFIVVIGSGYAGINPGAMTCDDSEMNTYSSIPVYDGGGAPKVQIFYVFNPTVSASMTFTVSATASFPSVTAFGFSGGSTGSAGNYANNVMDGSSNTGNTGTVVPTQGDALFIVGTSFIGSGFAARTFDSIDSSFTGLISAGYDGANNFGPGGAYKIKVADTSAENPTLTYSGNTGAAHVLMAFNPSGGGGGGGWGQLLGQKRDRLAA